MMMNSTGLIPAMAPEKKYRMVSEMRPFSSRMLTARATPTTSATLMRSPQPPMYSSMKTSSSRPQVKARIMEQARKTAVM